MALISFQPFPNSVSVAPFLFFFFCLYDVVVMYLGPCITLLTFKRRNNTPFHHATTDIIGLRGPLSAPGKQCRRSNDRTHHRDLTPLPTRWPSLFADDVLHTTLMPTDFYTLRKTPLSAIVFHLEPVCWHHVLYNQINTSKSSRLRSNSTVFNAAKASSG